MKKLLLTTSLALFTVAGAYAQITLTQSSFLTASTSGADTLFTTVTNPLYPTLTADAGANLDMTTVTSNTNVTQFYRVTGTGSNQWADSQALTFAGNFHYKAKLESSLTSTAYLASGEHVDRSATCLVGLTPPLFGAIPTDSLVINVQDIVFSSPRTKIAFPATVHSAWTSTYNFGFGFTLTYSLASLNAVPGSVHAYVTEKDSVIGYGKVRVKTANGGNSGYMDVLQIQSTTTTIDSFFLGGAPAPAQLLSALVLTQGQTTHAHEQYYYRVGELTPLVHITFDTLSGTTPTSAETQGARLPTFIPETQLTSTISVYPNPVTGRTIIVSGAPANYGNWNYELENVNGQVMTKGALQMNSNQSKTSIGLPDNVVPGTYFLHLYSNTAQETVRTLTIQ